MDNLEIGRVETNGLEMDYLRFGQGEEVLVILLGLSVEGIVKYANMVADPYADLAERYTIYVIDRRVELPKSYSVEHMAEDTAQAIRALGLSKVHLFGMSQGGMMALSIAAAHPDLVDKLVLASTSACVNDQTMQGFRDWIRLAEEGDASVLYRAFGQQIYPQAIYEQLAAMLEECSHNVTKAEMARFVVLAEGMGGFDMRDRLADITGPVMLTGSADDRVLGLEATQVIADGLTHCAELEKHVYDGYGHAAYDTAPDFRDRVLKFLMG